MSGTLHELVNIFMFISRLFLPGVRTVEIKVEEEIKTLFMYIQASVVYVRKFMISWKCNK